MTMQTLPAPLDAMRGEASGLDEFRLGSPREVAAMLRQLCDSAVPLNVNSASGCNVVALLWSVDAERGTLGLAVEIDDPGLPALIDGQEAVVVAYLDSVKVQFDLTDMVLVHGARGSTLKCGIPPEIYRFQRRSAYRVRPPTRSAPRARVRHSEIAEMMLSLRVLDLSIGGCALFLPDDVPPMRPGQALDGVQLELDADTRIGVNLRLQHVTSLNSEGRGVRLGCEFVRTDANAQRALQRFIDLAQKRGRLISLD